MKSIFISSDLAKDSIIRQLEGRYHLSYQSFIDFKAIPFTMPSHVDCLFFYSKNGVKFFFDSNPTIPKSITFAAMGSGTAALIKKYGMECTFVGKGNVEEIAMAFQAFIKDQHPFFVKAKNSLSSIQRILGNKIISSDLVVYDNQMKNGFSERKEDLLIFTSPMNVKAYVKLHRFKKDQQLIAIGERTALSLKEVSNSEIKIPKESTEQGIFDLIQEQEGFK